MSQRPETPEDFAREIARRRREVQEALAPFRDAETQAVEDHANTGDSA